MFTQECLLRSVGVMFIILLIIAIFIMKKELDSSIKRIDGFDRPSLNRDINYTILGLCLVSFLIGGVFTLIILS
jgi:hypothetical protein